ncbi:MAG: nickel pincer cofactor-dependent isomerase, group 22 [Terriglobia bacterium]
MITNGHNSLANFQILERVSATIPAIERLEDEIHRVLSSLDLPREKLKGRSIAVTAGSRGVASMKHITRAVCGWLVAQGAHPFVFPAMGSHGGATAEGQRKILQGYGVTEEFIGAPIRSSMETVSLGVTPDGFPAFMDRLAWEADGIVVTHRVKPHTSFSGTVESGLLKMMAVGMGKEDGARECHRAFRRGGYEKVIRAVSAITLASGKILCGMGVIENEMHEICSVRAAWPEGMIALDEACLTEARRLVPRLPFQNIQFLIVDEIGKNISGTGMDAKVVGRGAQHQAGEAPEISLIYARDLTAESGGNALGVGMADFIHERLRNKIDFEKMYVNGRTSMSHQMVRLPMVLPSDRDAMAFAVASLGGPAPSEQGTVWISNTQNLKRIAVSERLAREASGLRGWRLNPENFQPQFDKLGNLASPL